MNPLRRRSDRWQGVTAFAAILFMVSAIPVAIVLAAGTWQHQSAASEQELATWQHTTVTVLQGTRPTTAQPNSIATVSWRDQQGVTRRSVTSLAGDHTAGQTTRLWIDGNGRLAFAPINRADVLIDTTGAAMAVMSVAALAAALLYRGVVYRLDATRYRDIDTQWRQLNQARAPKTNN